MSSSTPTPAKLHPSSHQLTHEGEVHGATRASGIPLLEAQTGVVSNVVLVETRMGDVLSTSTAAIVREDGSRDSSTSPSLSRYNAHAHPRPLNLLDAPHVSSSSSGDMLSDITPTGSRRTSLTGTPHLTSVPSTPHSAGATTPNNRLRRSSKPLILAQGSNSKLKTFLMSHSVSSLRPSARSPSQIVEVDSRASLAQGFDTLLQHNILSAPVWDDNKKEYIGFLDLRDLVSSIIFAHDEQCLAAGPWNITSDAWVTVLERGFSRFGPGAITVSYLSRRNPFRPVDKNASLFAVAKALSQKLHRVPVVGDDGKCVAIISQSSLIHFLDQAMDKETRDEVNKQCVASLNVLTNVVSVTSDVSAWNAFKLLETSGCSGIAVVDKESGKLVGNTSARDLKLFVLDRGTLSLDVPILEYLSAIRQREQIITECHPSCSVGITSSVGHVIALLNATQFHRVFIVDKESMPIGVMSVTDILRFAVAEHGNVIAPQQ